MPLYQKHLWTLSLTLCTGEVSDPLKRYNITIVIVLDQRRIVLLLFFHSLSTTIYVSTRNVNDSGEYFDFSILFNTAKPLVLTGFYCTPKAGPTAGRQCPISNTYDVARAQYS